MSDTALRPALNAFRIALSTAQEQRLLLWLCAVFLAGALAVVLHAFSVITAFS